MSFVKHVAISASEVSIMTVYFIFCMELYFSSCWESFLDSHKMWDFFKKDTEGNFMGIWKMLVNSRKYPVFCMYYFYLPLFGSHNSVLSDG